MLLKNVDGRMLRLCEIFGRISLKTVVAQIVRTQLRLSQDRFSICGLGNAKKSGELLAPTDSCTILEPYSLGDPQIVFNSGSTPHKFEATK